MRSSHGPRRSSRRVRYNAVKRGRSRSASHGSEPYSFRPSYAGRDYQGKFGTDVHVRLEKEEGQKRPDIIIDVFDSKIKEPEAAHVTSESFPNTKSGRKDAVEFLKDEGITV